MWWQKVPPERLYLHTKLHGVTSQNSNHHREYLRFDNSTVKKEAVHFSEALVHSLTITHLRNHRQKLKYHKTKFRRDGLAKFSDRLAKAPANAKFN